MPQVLESQEVAANPVVLLRSIDAEMRELRSQQYYEKKWSPELEMRRAFLRRRRSILLQSLSLASL